jgi:hypothetical protein
MTKEWKELVLRTMQEKNISRADLARELGVTRGLITKMFGNQVASALVPKICDLLKIPPPLSPTEETAPRDVRIANLLGRMNDAQRDAAINFLETLLR